MGERAEIYGFDALRAFSVLLVIVSHVGIVEAARNPTLVKFFTVFNASYGVKTFFVLSGFLITTLLIKEHTKTGSVNVLNFMARRALRILPLYFLILAIIAVLIVAGIAQKSWGAMAFGTLYIFNFVPKALSVNYMSHLWSLAVEEQFYLVWPFLFAWWFSRKTVLILICVTVIVACYLTLGMDLGEISRKFFTDRWTIPAIYPIAIGALLALCMAPALGHGAVAIGSFALIAMPLFVTGSEFVSTFGIAGLIAWIYLNQNNVAVRALEWTPLKSIGVISYGLYMWQGLLTGNGPYRVVPGFPLDPMLGAVLTFPIAALSFYYFEKPIQRLKSHFPPDGRATAVSYTGTSLSQPRRLHLPF
jgi:peptidoglycan/LPS O-acetylase OafA/YrhL